MEIRFAKFAARFLVLLLIIQRCAAQTTHQGPQPLSVRLEESGAATDQANDSALTPDAIVKHIVESLPECLVRAPSNSAADAAVTFEQSADLADQDGHWRIRLTSALDPKGKTSSVATLEASEIELKLELQRLYIIKNLALLDVRDAEISLKVDGEAKPVYAAGDQFRVVFESSLDGYLNLINVRPEGTMCLLLPQTHEPLKVVAGVPVYLPSIGSIKVDKGPYGTEYLKAIFSTVVIDLDFLRCTGAEARPDVASLLAKAEAITTRARGIGGTGRNRVATADLRVQTAERNGP